MAYRRITLRRTKSIRATGDERRSVLLKLTGIGFNLDDVYRGRLFITSYASSRQGMYWFVRFFYQADSMVGGAYGAETDTK